MLVAAERSSSCDDSWLLAGPVHRHHLGGVPRRRRRGVRLPRETIELIDVLWLNGNAVVAAFEIESTTSIYSGLLRMADLVAMQPNLNIPLYLVAPDERRQRVFTEVSRPTFRSLSPPLEEICRYVSFEALREQLGQVAGFVSHLKPSFLDEISESCVVEEP
jgi:hypothetical protein